MDPGSALRFAALVRDDSGDWGARPGLTNELIGSHQPNTLVSACRRAVSPRHLGTRIPFFNKPDRKPRVFRVANDEI
ncbi:hypothetical protein JOE51_002980 [Bradyrhizobium japonicum]|nr:hypothetical protein BJA5080_06174 [Bradyrhizobium diazoefficiens SEMIA 5080]MBP1061513.1 hypothetical protein [Bradyrhizobium japonicum]BBZ98930.1 hypothetical protein F07S3_87630 [Bradyrhizobium diazoefficiens]BCA07982.1 hypothetical protein H12S4_88860 [Bradyrhizobium diazoefficiens]BCA16619.1 hypothetical protein BDHF08_84660 [Bradyrhizobium diazoefficiens]